MHFLVAGFLMTLDMLAAVGFADHLHLHAQRRTANRVRAEPRLW